MPNACWPSSASVCEPICHRGVYDFALRLPARARDAGIECCSKAAANSGPPPETVFLHRKLVGSFTVCARIQARVRVQDLIKLICRTEPCSGIMPKIRNKVRPHARRRRLAAPAAAGASGGGDNSGNSLCDSIPDRITSRMVGLRPGFTGR
jgi:hypothetical protein